MEHHHLHLHPQKYVNDVSVEQVVHLMNVFHFVVEILFIQPVFIYSFFFYLDWLFFICKQKTGRPAWYDASGEIKEAFVIGICGGSASGKTTVAEHIVGKLNVPWVTLLSMDSFYKVKFPI